MKIRTITYDVEASIMENLRIVCYGQGIHEYADEDKYSGECKYDNMHGQGTCKWASGSEDDGEWKDGEYIG